jgi:hypothetical protein
LHSGLGRERAEQVAATLMSSQHGSRKPIALEDKEIGRATNPSRVLSEIPSWWHKAYGIR